MSNALTSLIFGIGLGGWVYVMFVKNSNNQRNAWIGATVAGIAGFFVIFSLLEIVLGW